MISIHLKRNHTIPFLLDMLSRIISIVLEVLITMIFVLTLLWYIFKLVLVIVGLAFSLRFISKRAPLVQMAPMLIWWFIMGRIVKLGISENGPLLIDKSIRSIDPWRKPEYVNIQKNLLLYWKITTKVMIFIFLNSTLRMINW